MSTNAQVIFDYIFGLTGAGVKLEMSRVESFMKAIGEPYLSYPVIHIAGTNGKGSTASMFAALLRGYGYRVGLFTSPHLVIPNERIRVDDQLIPDEFIISKVESWRDMIDELGITFFEVLTALGFAYFKSQNVDYAVIETGLGGRLDATNVVHPTLTVITAISMDHENILGDTLELIAAEKAGIIKQGIPVVLGKNSGTVRALIQERALQQSAPYIYAPLTSEVSLVQSTFAGQEVKVDLAGHAFGLELPLQGPHQRDNLQNVLASLTLLGLEIDPETIQSGLHDLSWRGRMEVLHDSPKVLYDVAHNPEGLERLMEALRESGEETAVMVAAFNARKNIQGLVDMLRTWDGPVVYTIFDGHSAVSEETLLQTGIPSDLIVGAPEQAYAWACKTFSGEQRTFCFFGSHYLAESLYELFKEAES